MKARKGGATDEERRAVVAALLEAATAANNGADVGSTIRALLDRVRALRPSSSSQTTTTEPTSAPSTSTALAVVPALPATEEDPVLVLELQDVTTATTAKASAKARAEKAAVLAVFSHWIRVTERGAGSKLTPDRVAKIRSRLAEGYSVDEMKRAIDGCAHSSHHQGQNDAATRYDDLTLIFRTGAKLEWFRDMAPEFETPKIGEPKKADPAKAREDRELQELRERANELLAKGDTKGYGDAIRTIKQRTNHTG